MNSTERVRLFRLNQKEKGRLKREFYLDSIEWEKVKQYIKELRNEKN